MNHLNENVAAGSGHASNRLFEKSAELRRKSSEANQKLDELKKKTSELLHPELKKQ